MCVRVRETDRERDRERERESWISSRQTSISRERTLAQCDTYKVKRYAFIYQINLIPRPFHLYIILRFMLNSTNEYSYNRYTIIFTHLCRLNSLSGHGFDILQIKTFYTELNVIVKC